MVANLGLTTNVPGEQKIVAATPTKVSGISVTDPELFHNATVTVVISDGTGLLSATAAGTAILSGGGSNSLTIKGHLDDVNTTLASLTYLAPAGSVTNSDRIDVLASDSAGAGDDEKIPVIVLQVPSAVTDAAVIDFKTADQSMWTSGKALKINDSIPLLGAAIGPVNVTAFDGDFTATGSANAGLNLNLVANTGGISLDYPLNGGFILPNAVAPGQEFTVTTLDNGLANGAGLTGKFPTFNLSLDATFSADFSASIDSDWLGSDTFSYNTDQTYRLFDLKSGEKKDLDGFHFEIPASYASQSNQIGGGGLPTITLNATTPDIASVSVDLIKLIGDLIGPEFPSLSGSFLGGAVSYDIASAVLHAGIAIAQQFTFVPTAVVAIITTPWGDAAEVALGQGATFTVPTGWTDPVALTTTYSITGNLVSNSGLTGSADLDVSLLSGHADVLGSFGPLFQDDILIYQATPVYFINPGGPGGFDFEGFNSPTDSATIPLATVTVIAPDATAIDTIGYSANAAQTLQAVVSELAGMGSRTNLYDPAHSTGSATAIDQYFNIEVIEPDGATHTLPPGFKAGIIKAGSSSATLIDTAGGVLLAGANPGDILRGTGNDTLVGGQSGGMEFDIPSTFSGEIDGLELGDVINIAGITATSASLGGSTLTVSYGSGANAATLSIPVSGTITNGKLVFQDDGEGGTDLVLYRLAAAKVNAHKATVTLPNAHVGDRNDQVFLTIANTAQAPAEALVLGSVESEGDVFVGGPLNVVVAPGATSTSDVAVGIVGDTPGQESGTVTLRFYSDGDSVSGDHGSTDLAPIALTVRGNVYRLAQAAVTGTMAAVHVGDIFAAPLIVTNIAPADGFSEELIAATAAVSGGITAAGTTGDIAPGASSNAITFSAPATSVGIMTGRVTLNLTSDGMAIDGLGTTALQTQDIDVSVSVNNYAQPAFSLIGGIGTFGQNGNAFTLDLGMLAQTARGQTGTQVALQLANTALAGPQDSLGGAFSIKGSGAYVNEGFGTLDPIAPGTSNSDLLLFLHTDMAGSFSETITFSPLSGNISSSSALAVETITVTGTVVAPAVSAPKAITVPLAQKTAISGVSVTDIGQNPFVTVQLGDSNGVLWVDPTLPIIIDGDRFNNLFFNGAQNFSITGQLTEVNTALATLTDTYSSAGPDIINISGSILDGTGAGLSLTKASVVVNANALFDFSYTYADGKAGYGGTVADDGSFGYAKFAAQDDPITSSNGTYRLSAAGATTNASGTVTVTHYSDIQSGRTYQIDHANNGGKDGVNGLESESEQFYVNSQLFQFTRKVEANSPPAPIDQQIEDFNADGTSDILWQRGDGGLMIYGVGDYEVVAQPSLGQIGGEQQFKGIGDYNGDGTSDVLWQGDDGELTIYSIVADTIAGVPVLGRIGREWHFKTVGDFNADKTSDILWQRDDGRLMIYNVGGNEVVGSVANAGHIGPEWYFDGVGDFNGDGTSDLLWQRADGALMVHDVNASEVTSSTEIGRIGLEWNFLGGGDFNNDGTSDLLWQRADGELMVYQLGNNQVTASPTAGAIGREWHFLDVGDYNGDGTSDILWERDDGGLMVYGVKNNLVTTTPTLGSIGTEWRVLPLNAPVVVTDAAKGAAAAMQANSGVPQGLPSGDGIIVGIGETVIISAGETVTNPTIDGGTLILGNGAIVAGAIAFAPGATGILVDEDRAAYSDTVIGFTDGADFLRFGGENAASEASVVASATTSAGNTVLSFPDGTSLLLVGVSQVDTGIFA